MISCIRRYNLDINKFTEDLNIQNLQGFYKEVIKSIKTPHSKYMVN